jgi:phosphoribosylformimino-5-aminoimidazole carboxamide ribotide isomerase
VELYPAIDVRGGRCVRLRQGDYGDETIYGEDPVEVAAGFVAAGARWIHVVDLDAARTGTPINRDVVAAVARTAAAGGGQVQSGGGVRSEAAAHALWDAGVQRVVLGTAAVEDPGLVGRLAAARVGGVAVGLDTRGGEVAVRGWVEGSGATAAAVLERLAGMGVAAVVVTEIGRDGMLTGPDVAGLGAVLDATDIEVIASGGVASVDDLATLAALRGPASGRRLGGAIVGKALYEGRLTVEEGMAACAASA